MTSRGEMLYPVLPQAESTLDSIKLTVVSLFKQKKFTLVLFLRFQLFMRNYLNELTKILQFTKTDSVNRFYGKKTSRKPLHHFFVRFYFVSVLSL